MRLLDELANCQDSPGARRATTVTEVALESRGKTRWPGFPRDRERCGKGDSARGGHYVCRSAASPRRPDVEQGTVTVDPLAEYRVRLNQRQSEVDRLSRADRALANWRLGVFGIGAALAALIFVAGSPSPWWLLAPTVVFAALVVVHDRVLRRLEQARRAVDFYERGVARLEHRWQGLGNSGERFVPPDHAYAADLDLFGPGSLFELLCTARTARGEAMLAQWLLAPAEAAEIRRRQEAVDDLRRRLDLREALWLIGSSVREGVDADSIARWCEEAGGAPPAWLRAAAAGLAATSLGGLAAWGLGAPGLAFGIPFGVAQLFALGLGRRTAAATRGLTRAARELSLVQGLLARIEAETATTALLAQLHARLAGCGVPPSARIAALQRLVELLDSQRSIFFAPIGLVLLWTTQLGLSIEHWRAVNGPNLGTWLSIVGEFEALCCLASYAWEHPADPFAELADAGTDVLAEGLTHPLLPEGSAVRNDLRLGPAQRLLIVSGSNMSGKSTLLRSLGINVVLALAGAPVRARRLALMPVALGASIRIHDSLQEGRSRFFAEILRLRQIVELAGGPLPVLFLLDEILHGTNSHDRRIGAEAVLRTLINRGAVGLVTTHDLALARVADDSGLQAVNVHFQDELHDGRMAFDYRLWPGVVRKSNALELMRAVGLDVAQHGIVAAEDGERSPDRQGPPGAAPNG